jgi:hypothetical protein
MDNLFEKKEEKKGLNKGFLIGGLVGVIMIGLLVLLAMQKPSMVDQEAAVLADALRPGSPQFDEITKDIVIGTNGDRTVQFSNAFGGISMSIEGNIRNKGTRTINGLEVNVSVVDQFNGVVKDKNVLAIPKHREVLAPGDAIPITLALDGFKKGDDRANIRWKVTAIRVP